MSGQWPPEWDDQDTVHPDAEYPDTEASEVTSFLASVPLPALPANVEARISAAIAAAAAERAATAVTETTEPDNGGAVAAKTTVRSPHSAPPNRPADSRPGGRRRRLRLPPAAVLATLVICLFAAGLGYLSSQGGSSSSAAATSPVAAPASSPSHAAAFGGTSSVPEREGMSGANSSGHAGFLVTESGTSYQGSTLADQVRDQLAANSGSIPTASAEPSASATGIEASAAASAPSAGIEPSAALAGCVSHLTGGATPSLVDRASYDGSQAYIIAVPSRAWVVGLNCTATDPHLITTVPLTGLSGNLRALGSVER